MSPAILPPWRAICAPSSPPVMRSNPSPLPTCFLKHSTWKPWSNCAAPDRLIQQKPLLFRAHASGIGQLPALIFRLCAAQPPPSLQPDSALSCGMAFRLGIAVAHWPGCVQPGAARAGAGCTPLCVAALRAQHVVWLPLAALWFLLGAWCALMEPHPAPAPASPLSDGLLRTVEGTVVSTGSGQNQNDEGEEAGGRRPRATHRSARLTIETVADTADARHLPAAARAADRALASDAASPPAPFHCGDRIRAVVRLLPPEIYHDPGVWSREDYLLDQGITSRLSDRPRSNTSASSRHPRTFCLPH